MKEISELPLEAIFERYMDMKKIRLPNLNEGILPRNSKSLRTNSNVTQHLSDAFSQHRLTLNSEPFSISPLASVLPLPCCYKTEDLIAPVLDSTAELFANPYTNYNDITVVFSQKSVCDNTRRYSLSLPQSRQRSISRTSEKELKRENTIGRFNRNDPAASSCANQEQQKTIEFYSFADAVKAEYELERLDCRKLSEVINLVSDLEEED